MPAVVDEQAAELVLPLMESAQTLTGQLAALAGVDLAQLLAPWGSFVREALITIQTTNNTAVSVTTRRLTCEGVSQSSGAGCS